MPTIPFDWLPWGPVALARAREQDTPLLVSIGYSACHWCHVMERESFTDERTAALMNELFVCVKVDREERPDVDALYMEAVQGMTGHGGWPLNVFLTPEQLPFYGGTYFPPEPRAGMPAWTQVLQAIGEAWETQREEIRAGGERLRERLAGGALLRPSAVPLTAAALDEAVAGLRAEYDPVNGGFGGPPTYAPKFPQASVLEFLLARAGVDAASPDMAVQTLRAMAAGGIYDQLGGGFHRYAVDASWTVPHFEKMLYDNALLARAYLHGWRLTGELRLQQVCRETLDWALREMRGPEGGFYAALDADSEGVEGKYYVWRAEEIGALLGQDADAAIAWFGVTEAGNFHEHGVNGDLNVLQAHGPEPPAGGRDRIRARLLAARSRRTPPGLDDKRLTSWNALMISALADAGAGLEGAVGQRYLDAARACGAFILARMRDEQGHVLRTFSAGKAALHGYLEDYALLLEALITLFEASCEERWFEEARSLADMLIERFADPDNGGFYSTATGGEALVVRRKELEDAPIPSGASSAAMGLLRLGELTGEAEYERHGLGAMALVREIAPRHPRAFGHMLQAMHWRLAPPRPIACPVPGLQNR